MPRIIFESVDELSRWLKIHYIRGYEGYISPLENEIVLIPTKSTRPLLYVYYKYNNDKELAEIKTLLDSLKIQYYTVKRLEWVEDRPLGAKFITEEEI